MTTTTETRPQWTADGLWLDPDGRLPKFSPEGRLLEPFAIVRDDGRTETYPVGCTHLPYTGPMWAAIKEALRAARAHAAKKEAVLTQDQQGRVVDAVTLAFVRRCRATTNPDDPELVPALAQQTVASIVGGESAAQHGGPKAALTRAVDAALARGEEELIGIPAAIATSPNPAVRDGTVVPSGYAQVPGRAGSARQRVQRELGAQRRVQQDGPPPGVQIALTGPAGTASIANRNTWRESVVDPATGRAGPAPAAPTPPRYVPVQPRDEQRVNVAQEARQLAVGAAAAIVAGVVAPTAAANAARVQSDPHATKVDAPAGTEAHLGRDRTNDTLYFVVAHTSRKIGVGFTTQVEALEYAKGRGWTVVSGVK